MLYWSWFLHFYQPPTQFPQVTKKISSESYEKILKILQTHKNAYLTVNFSASLAEQLVNLGLGKIIDGFAELAQEGRIEFTGSAAYHPLLPRIPGKEIERQIKLNEEINRKYFGPFGKLRAGFFPPEMAYSPKVGEVVERLGYKWIILDESAIKMKNENRKLKNEIFERGELAVFVRNRDLSLKIAFSKITSVEELSHFLKGGKDGYVIAALDGETFGHHQPGQLKFLEELFKCQMKFVTVSELLNLFPKRSEIEPKTSSWGDSFKRWDDPKNPIHRLQWKLYNLALSGHPSPEPRLLLDQALHSDQFWWASHSPCWHPKMIERGARMLRDVEMLDPRVGEKEKRQAQKLYNDIILTGRKLYGEEIIPC